MQRDSNFQYSNHKLAKYKFHVNFMLFDIFQCAHTIVSLLFKLEANVQPWIVAQRATTLTSVWSQVPSKRLAIYLFYEYNN